MYIFKVKIYLNSYTSDATIMLSSYHTTKNTDQTQIDQTT